MLIRLNSEGDIERDPALPGPKFGRQLGSMLQEPGEVSPESLQNRSLEAGVLANAVLERAEAPFVEDPLKNVRVVPGLLELAAQNPIGLTERYVERAVTTMIAAVVGATRGEWSIGHTRLAFAAAFGLDARSSLLRSGLIGPMDPSPLGGIEEDLPENLRAVLEGLIPSPGDGLPPGPLDDLEVFRPLDDLFERTCLLGVFDALHEVGRALAEAPREYSAAHIDELIPNRGCRGDKITIRGTGFGPTQAPGLELMFPAFAGGWISILVDQQNWTDTLIIAVVPDGVGTGPVGFIYVDPSSTTVVGSAVSDFVGEVGACLGAGAQLSAGSVFGKLGPIGKATITQTGTNLFHGGPPKIDYFLANGAQRALLRPGGDLRLQWSALNADQVTIQVVGTPAPDQPPAPGGNLATRGEVVYQNVAGIGGWKGQYELSASNSCGQAKGRVEIDMQSRKALAFAGGGAKGSFEVGAARCLYDVFGYRPDLLVGASVGALNAAKLAEGPAALPELEQLWKDMVGPTDFFLIRRQIYTILQQLGPDMRRFLNLNPLVDLLGWTPPQTSTTVLNLNILARAISWSSSGIGSAAGASTLFTISDILFKALDLGLTIGKIVQAIQQLLLQPSLLLFDPVRDKIQASIDPAKVQASGIELRVVVNSVRNARVRYVDGRGAFVDGGPAPGLRSALEASASIPIAFPPVRLPDGEDYVDGGVLENVPIEAAVRAGADEVIAVLPSVARLRDLQTFPNALIPVTLRAIDLLLDGSSRRQLEPYRGWGVPVKVIAPRLELYNLLAVDPGLIRIQMDYGYMCAYDEMQANEALRSLYRASSDAIASLRKEIWYQEHFANAVYPKGFLNSGQIQPTGSAEEVLWIRGKKREVRDLVLRRMALEPGSGRISVPPTIAEAWTSWEAHFFDTLFPTPWNDFSSYPGPLLLRENPPPPLP
jgi:predicted acylesterase/phospholipase RssA